MFTSLFHFLKHVVFVIEELLTKNLKHFLKTINITFHLYFFFLKFFL